MEITAQMVKDLREKTGAGMMACKAALAESSGDMDEAIEILRKKGAADLQKKADRAANEGYIDAYIHGGRIGVLIEVNCETDFVAKNEDFKQFVHDLAMQVAALKPMYVSSEDVPQNLIDKEMEIYMEAARKEGKPEKILEQIAQGKLSKFFEEICLLDQKFVKNPDITITDYLHDIAAKIGENIKIRRFTRYELGAE